MPMSMLGWPKKFREDLWCAISKYVTDITQLLLNIYIYNLFYLSYLLIYLFIHLFMLCVCTLRLFNIAMENRPFIDYL